MTVSPKIATHRRNLATVFTLTLIAFAASVVFYPDLYDSLAGWLNLYDWRNERLLDWARAFNLVMVGITIHNLGKIMYRFPTRKRFYLMMWPLLGAALYFTAQFMAEGTGVYPRNGIILINLFSGLICAGYSVSLGLLQEANLQWRRR